jgi:hypothetical protein
LRRQKDVGGLDVAMNDPAGMRRFQRRRNLQRDVDQFFRRNGAFRYSLLQRFALQIFHHDEWLPLMLTNVVDRADLWMIQRGRRARLETEAFQSLRIT